MASDAFLHHTGTSARLSLAHETDTSAVSVPCQSISAEHSNLSEKRGATCYPVGCLRCMFREIRARKHEPGVDLICDVLCYHSIRRWQRRAAVLHPQECNGPFTSSDDSRSRYRRQCNGIARASGRFQRNVVIVRVGSVTDCSKPFAGRPCSLRSVRSLSADPQ